MQGSFFVGFTGPLHLSFLKELSSLVPFNPDWALQHSKMYLSKQKLKNQAAKTLLKLPSYQKNHSQNVKYENSPK